MNYLHYMAIFHIVKFEIPKYLENLIGKKALKDLLDLSAYFNIWKKLNMEWR